MNAPAAVTSSSRQSSRWLEVVADPVRLQILRALTQVGEATASDLAGHSQTSYQTLRRHLDALETFGVIHAKPGKSDGETPGRPAARFSLQPEIRESVCSVFGPSP
ncbi:MAG TPA: winged helix-turn-helix domain-containing protein [Solirubrobacterales bacterium]